ncbi:hypothetical protein EJB05_05262, partial [Eragrostis curvula]
PIRPCIASALKASQAEQVRATQPQTCNNKVLQGVVTRASVRLAVAAARGRGRIYPYPPLTAQAPQLALARLMKCRTCGTRLTNDENTTTIRVTNLPEGTTESDLLELFNVFGLIRRVHVAADEAAGSADSRIFSEAGSRACYQDAQRICL